MIVSQQRKWLRGGFYIIVAILALVLISSLLMLFSCFVDYGKMFGCYHGGYSGVAGDDMFGDDHRGRMMGYHGKMHGSFGGGKYFVMYLLSVAVLVSMAVILFFLSRFPVSDAGAEGDSK